MHDMNRRQALLADLGTFGSDFSRWPQDRMSGAPQACLQDRDFRRAWEGERELDRGIAAEREAWDQEVAGSGTIERVRRRTLARLPGPLAGLGWQRIAAAALVAGMLGGATERFIAQEAAPEEMVLLDPLYGLNDTGIQ